MISPSENNILKKVERKISSKGPKSLYFRLLLITLMPVLIVQIITAYIFYERHWESLSRNMISTLTGDIAMVVAEVGSLHKKDLERYSAAAYENLGFKVNIDENTKLNELKNINFSHRQLLNALKTKIDLPIAMFKEKNGKLRLSVQEKNDVINIIFTDKRLINPSTYIFTLWVVGAAVLLSCISVLFMRGQVRSILHLSKAAESFGKGSDIIEFKPSGAREIRLAGIAFIEMKERIRRLIDTRTQMLAGVSHDLKTPLTRIKLITSMMDAGKEKNALTEEVDEMNKMIEGYLSFAQLEMSRQIVESIQSVNLKEFIESITRRYENFSNEITTNIQENIFLNIRPLYLKRAFTNLIDNAIKYSSRLDITAEVQPEGVFIVFEDNGPGIPDDKLEQVFLPFYRLDESRNSETGGVGLGLSITRDIINKHGGDITLAKSSSGGLKVTVIIPE